MLPLASSSTPSRILRVGLVSPVQGLDPRGAIDFVNIIVLWQMYETLLAPAIGDERPKPLLLKEPLLAERSSGKSRTYSASLHDGAKLWDGTSLTAQRVVECLRRNTAFAEVADVTEKGGRILFTTKRPDVRLDLMLTRLDLAVVVEKNGVVLGTGAYMPAKGSTPERLRLVSNPHYRKPVSIGEIEFVAYPRDKDGKAEALRQAIKEKRVDFTTFLRRDEIDDLIGVRKSFELGTSTAILFFNTERPPLDDVRVRKAMARAIDRVAITQLFYHVPLAYVATGLLPPALGRLPDGLVHNLPIAKALLAETNIRPGERPLKMFTIWGPRPYLPRPADATNMIVKQLGQLGFRSEVSMASDVSDYYEQMERGDYDLVLAGYVPDTPHAVDFLDILLSSERIPNGKATVMNSVNLARWRSRALDEALTRLRVERTPESQSAIARILGEEVPLLPLMYGPTIAVYTSRLKNYPPSFFAQPFFATMTLEG